MAMMTAYVLSVFACAVVLGVVSMGTVTAVTKVAAATATVTNSQQSQQHQQQMQHSATDECRLDQQDQTTLVCHLRSNNNSNNNNNANDGNDGNLNIMPPKTTLRLRLECNDELFFQNALNLNSFRQLKHLQSLQMVRCKIGRLNNDSFMGLRSMRNLTIKTFNTDWSSMGLEIANDVFSSNSDDMANLMRLDLSENNMWSVPVGVFCSLRNLIYLNLTRNRLHDVNNLYMSSKRKCATQLKTLDLSLNNLENLPFSVFSGLHNLTELSIQNNRVSFIADSAFEGLTALAIVRLNGNGLHSLPPDLFNETKLLREIYLQNNSINVLAPEIFSGLNQLLILDLSANQLSSEWINSATFKGLYRLTTLDLSANKLTKIEPAIFKDLKNIETIKLNDNHLRHVEDKTFMGLTKLHSLTLSSNRLLSVRPNVFSGLQGLKLLSIDFNRISKFDQRTFLHCPKIEELFLNGNKLDKIPSGLGDMPGLRSLDLGENQIKTLDNDSFSELTNVYGLRLTENYIETIRCGVFDKMTALQILNLSRNKIRHIEIGAFDNNQNLQAIRLDGNQLKNISMLFIKLPNLVWLNMSENQLDEFDYAMIPAQLQWLDIHANRVKKLGNYFEIESQLALTNFDASSNLLTEITGSAIPSSMEIMYLNDNLISKVQSYSFFKKPNITRVDLFGNKITTLDPNALRISIVPQSRPLPEFYIGGNPYLCDCNLDWLQNVNTEHRTQPRLMDLASIYCKLLYNRGKTYVPLVEAQPNQFLCQYNSHCLALCHCCDFNACDCKMECPDRCTCYHDQSWTSNVVDCSRANYKQKLPDQIPMDATQIYLDGNIFPELASHAFIGRRKLKVLFLNNSNIEVISNRTFFGLKNLEMLNLARNRLAHLIDYEFDGLDSLKELYLQDNLISTIHKNALSSLQKLKTLRLDNNRMTQIDLVQIPIGVNDLRLSENPWACECETLEEFKSYLSRDIVRDKYRVKCYRATAIATVAAAASATRAALAAVDHANNDNLSDVGTAATKVIVNSNNNNNNSSSNADNVEGYIIINANATNICDTTELALNFNASGINSTKTILGHRRLDHYLPLFTTLSGLLLIIVVSLLFIFIFRQEMKVWMHSRFGVRLFHRDTTAIDKHERDKLFDAFVSYSSKDEAFVVETLAPVLENGDPQYKLCLHYRDFPVGAYIADTIVQAIDSSRRTIMILSKNFIKSEWCRFEFKSAHHQVLRDRRRCLIVILLGDVPHKDLDPDIRLYLKTNTYLQWGDKLFWEKLRFALPDVYNNQRRNVSVTQMAVSRSNRFTHNNVTATAPQSMSAMGNSDNRIPNSSMSSPAPSAPMTHHLTSSSSGGPPTMPLPLPPTSHIVPSMMGINRTATVQL